MVFYRKYRPQKLSELDSESARSSLSTILSSKEVPHALLFTGSRGLGKTSAARIVAKIVNCERKKGTEPCNKCDQCVSITNGTNLDVLEIDGASNRGIDEVRDLREKIRLSPSAASYKVYIIDEVHMLTTEAFNALLKTLEEPPAHAIFILCTTEPHKVPKTIESRCFHVVFKRANKAELKRSLSRIIRSEKIRIEDEAIAKIVDSSDGSFRDAAKILEIAVLRSSRRKKITKETILELLGNSIHSRDFIELLAGKDARTALEWLNQSINKGLNIKIWLEDLLAIFHNALLHKYRIENEGTYEVEGFSEEELKRLISLFSKAHQDMRTSVIPQLPAELAIIEYCME